MYYLLRSRWEDSQRWRSLRSRQPLSVPAVSIIQAQPRLAAVRVARQPLTCAVNRETTRGCTGRHGHWQHGASPGVRCAQCWLVTPPPAGPAIQHLPRPARHLHHAPKPAPLPHPGPIDAAQFFDGSHKAAKPKSKRPVRGKATQGVKLGGVVRQPDPSAVALACCTAGRLPSRCTYALAPAPPLC